MSLNILKATLDNLENDRKKILIEIDFCLNRSNIIDGQKKIVDKLTELFSNLSNIEGAMRVLGEVIIENTNAQSRDENTVIQKPIPPPSQTIKEGEDPKNK